MNTEIVAWSIATYLIASIPFSVLIGYLIVGRDIRGVGDANPGATNVLRASGSKIWFIIAVLLDAAKGALPVGVAYWVVGFHGLEIIPIAIAAVLGHAFSIFLGFRGGKAVAITGGVWTGLTVMEGPVVIGLMLTYWFLSVDSSDWAVVLMMLSLLLYLLIGHSGNPAFLLVWLGNFIILVHRHRHGLVRRPNIKRWLPFLPKHDGVVR